MSIFKKIGAFFASLFNAIRRAYLQLTPEQQNAIKSGSGIVDIINNNLEKAADEIRDLIQAKFPNINVDTIETVLFDAADTLGIVPVDTDNLNDLIDILRSRLATLKEENGTKWATYSHALATALAILFAPKDTKVSQVVLVIEWVYQTFFKKKSV